MSPLRLCGRDRRRPQPASAPTEQPPRKLSGTKDRIAGRSGERRDVRPPKGYPRLRQGLRGSSQVQQQMGITEPDRCPVHVPSGARRVPMADRIRSNPVPHIAVVGAGITGVTTAYALAQKGYAVTVFDRHRYAAMETSFANGGQLSASNAEVWNHWSTVAKGIAWMFP